MGESEVNQWDLEVIKYRFNRRRNDFLYSAITVPQPLSAGGCCKQRAKQVGAGQSGEAQRWSGIVRTGGLSVLPPQVE